MVLKEMSSKKTIEISTIDMEETSPKMMRKTSESSTTQGIHQREIMDSKIMRKKRTLKRTDSIIKDLEKENLLMDLLTSMIAVTLRDTQEEEEERENLSTFKFLLENKTAVTMIILVSTIDKDQDLSRDQTLWTKIKKTMRDSSLVIKVSGTLMISKTKKSTREEAKETSSKIREDQTLMRMRTKALKDLLALQEKIEEEKVAITSAWMTRKKDTRSEAREEKRVLQIKEIKGQTSDKTLTKAMRIIRIMPLSLTESKAEKRDSTKSKPK